MFGKGFSSHCSRTEKLRFLEEQRNGNECPREVRIAIRPAGSRTRLRAMKTASSLGGGQRPASNTRNIAGLREPWKHYNRGLSVGPLWMSTGFDARRRRNGIDELSAFWSRGSENSGMIRPPRCAGECYSVGRKTANTGRGNFRAAVFVPTWDNLSSPMIRTR
jgi:hypothetical protein